MMLHYTLQHVVLVQMLLVVGKIPANISRYENRLKQSPGAIPSLDSECTKPQPQCWHWLQAPPPTICFQAFHCTDGGGLGQMLSMQGHLHFHDIALAQNKPLSSLTSNC